MLTKNNVLSMFFSAAIPVIVFFLQKSEVYGGWNNDSSNSATNSATININNTNSDPVVIADTTGSSSVSYSGGTLRITLACSMSGAVYATGPGDVGATQDLDMKVWGQGGWTSGGDTSDSELTYSLSITGSISGSLYWWNGGDPDESRSGSASASENLNVNSAAAGLNANCEISGSVGYTYADGSGESDTPTLTYSSIMSVSGGADDTGFDGSFTISYNSGEYSIPNGTTQVHVSGSIEAIGTVSASESSTGTEESYAFVGGGEGGIISVSISGGGG